MSLAGTTLCLDISGSRTLLAALTDGRLGAIREVPNQSGTAAGYFPEVLDAAKAVARESGAARVGVSFGGPVDHRGQVVSIHVGGWGEVDLVGGLSGRLGLPVKIENDANCGALGEYHCGAWGELRTLVFLTCSTGIGGGIVSSGTLFKGSRGLAGELGHIPLRADGPDCPCGSKGCLEALCSGTAVARRATEALAGRQSVLRHHLVEGRLPGAKPVYDAAAAGDALAQQVLAEVFEDFGRGIAAIHNALDPDIIVIGGGVSLAGERLSGPVADAARPWVMAHRREMLRVGTASLGLSSQMYGAAALWLAEHRAVWPPEVAR